MKKQPFVLCIMDGFAISNKSYGNAIFSAKKPHLDALFARYPMMLLQASGQAVGLPDKQIGNSEVGHMNIGAGRVVFQSLSFLHQKMQQGDFAFNPAFQQAFDYAINNHVSLHIVGLLSEGGVHSHQEHLFALLALAKAKGVAQTYVHVILDGRDVDPQAGKKSVHQLLLLMEKLNYGEIASISGRYYAMDRDKNFSRLDKAYKVMVERKGASFNDPLAYIGQEYALQTKEKKVASDEFVLPAFNQKIEGQIKEGDSVIFANFRPDRAIQLATILTNPLFYEAFGYVPSCILSSLFMVTMMPYGDSIKALVAYHLDELKQPLGVYLANSGKTQLRIAETEKYAHVTFFFDGMINYDGGTYPLLKGSKRLLIPSLKVATYDLQPAMSAVAITDALLNELDHNDYDVVILNFANCDMVGHTAVFDATVKAVETVDACVGRLYTYLDKNGGTLLLTADHGNADCLLDEKGNPVTAHTTNPVPFVICDNDYAFIAKKGKLADIAPTLLTLMDLPIPKEMTGDVLVRKKR